MKVFFFIVAVLFLGGCGDPACFETGTIRYIDPAAVRHGVYSSSAGKFNPDGTPFVDNFAFMSQRR